MNKYYSSRIPYCRWLFLTLILFSLQSKALTQDSVQISINAVNKPIEVVFKQIENQTGYTVFYGRPTLNGDEIITLQTRASLSSVMNAVLKGRNISWALKDKSIILTRRTANGNGSNNIDTIPKINITGSIVDKSGVPISGATVSIRGQLMGQVTDKMGEFRFANIPSNTVLVISSIGYTTRQYRLSGEQEAYIILDTLVQEIRPVDVVSTGYQQISKERTAGSFVQIDNELFNRRVGATVLDRLNDLVPGLLRRPGTINPLTQLSIRGVSTINASTAVLLVVDNFIYDGDPNSLNPNDIESVTVLKDATAASIWGVRAGNGVIVVTTKKGKANRAPNISFVSNVTVSEKPRLGEIPSVPSRNVVELERSRFEKGYYNQSLTNTFSYPILSPVVEVLAKARSGIISKAEADRQLEMMSIHDIRDDIDKYLLQTAIAQQYALNISGGSNRHQYYSSIGYDRSRPNDVNIINNERLSLRFNSIWQPIDKVSVTAELGWTKTANNSQNSLGGYSKILNNPYTFLADEQGSPLAIPFGFRYNYMDTVSFPGKLDWKYVPINESRNGDMKSITNNLRIVGGLNYKIIRGLSVDVNYQWQTAYMNFREIKSQETFYTRNIINQHLTVGTNGRAVYPYPLGDIFSQSYANQSAWNIRGQLNFDRSFGKHQIASIFGVEAREVKSESVFMADQYGYNQSTNVFQPVQFGTWTTRPFGSALINPATSSIVGNLNRFGSVYLNGGYIYNQKYILNVSGRIDQSNFFGVKANDRRVPLWSVGGAWNISEENFYKVDWLPSLKIRATYGYSGNVNAGTSPLATIRYNNPVTFHPVFIPFASIATSPNPQLRWERVEIINFGVDARNKNGRLYGSIEIYQKRGLDLISQIAIAQSSGFETYTGNSSSIKGKGVDISVNSVNVNKEVRWTSALVFGYNEEKVIAYTAKLPTGFISPSGYSSIPTINKPLSQLYSYQWAGLNPTSGDAQFYLKSQKANSSDISKATFSDYKYNGRTIPPYFGALRNDVSWKNISISISVNYAFGHYFRRQSFNGILGTANSIATWAHNDYLNAWKKPGDELLTNVPGFLDTYPDSRYNIYQDSDILIEKGDYIRLQDLRLSYSLNKQAYHSLPAKNVSIYLYANNLAFLWKASRYNPDTSGGLSAPLSRSISLGLNAQF